TDLERGRIHLDKVRDSRRQTFNVQLPQVVVQHPAFFDSGRHSAYQTHRHLDPTRLLHRDFEQIHMEDLSRHWIHLIVTKECSPSRFRCRTHDPKRDERGAPTTRMQHLSHGLRIQREQETFSLAIQNSRDLSVPSQLAGGSFPRLLSYCSLHL